MMDVAMPKDFLPELLTNMQKQLDRIENKTDKQTDKLGAIELHTQSMSNDIEQAKTDIKKLEASSGRRINIDGTTIKLIALACVIGLSVVAAWYGVNVEALFK
jgi:Mg2+ and Co2+ transporter CorA